MHVAVSQHDVARRQPDHQRPAVGPIGQRPELDVLDDEVAALDLPETARQRPAGGAHAPHEHRLRGGSRGDDGRRARMRRVVGAVQFDHGAGGQFDRDGAAWSGGRAVRDCRSPCCRASRHPRSRSRAWGSPRDVGGSGAVSATPKAGAGIPIGGVHCADAARGTRPLRPARRTNRAGSENVHRAVPSISRTPGQPRPLPERVAEPLCASGCAGKGLMVRRFPSSCRQSSGGRRRCSPSARSSASRCSRPSRRCARRRRPCRRRPGRQPT